MPAGEPRLRAQLLDELVEAIRARGSWDAVAAHLPAGWTVPGVQQGDDAWVGLAAYVALLDAVGAVLDVDEVRHLGFLDAPRAEDSLVGGKIEKLGAALVTQPVDWLTLPGWLWRSMTRNAGVMRKIELGDTHVVFRLERLPGPLVHHATFHARVAGLLESMARRSQDRSSTEIEVVEGRQPVVQFRISWSACE